jgi:transcriptional regulator with XRE-family HTH domain
MSTEEINQREAYFKEFGEILVRRHGQNFYSSYHNASRITVDDASIRFGRYLRAARVNAGLSPAELAGQVRLSEATLAALEQGFILACDIKPKWLKELAGALGENFEDFNLIVGRQISSGHSRWLTERLISHWQNWLTQSKVSSSSRLIYATCSTMLFYVVVGAISLLSFKAAQQPSAPRKAYSFIDVKPEYRLNRIKAELRLENQIILLSTNLGGGAC